MCFDPVSAQSGAVNILFAECWSSKKVSFQEIEENSEDDDDEDRTFGSFFRGRPARIYEFRSSSSRLTPLATSPDDSSEAQPFTQLAENFNTQVGNIAIEPAPEFSTRICQTRISSGKTGHSMRMPTVVKTQAGNICCGSIQTTECSTQLQTTQHLKTCRGECAKERDMTWRLHQTCIYHTQLCVSLLFHPHPTPH